MITKIGLVAGDIWNYLDAHNKADRLDNIMTALGKERDIALMALGWLAREGHVVLEGDAPDYVVRLTD